MSVLTRLQPINLDLDFIFAEEMAPAARSAHLAAFARESLAEAQATNRAALGRVPPHETVVDGRIGAAVETVRADGVIVFEFHLLEELFIWIADQLVKHSPRLTGRYSDSHLFFADGVEVRTGEPAPPAAEYAFVNAQPYARKIERGLSKQAPDGVFESVATLAKRRFGNVATIRFGFRSLPAGAVGKWAETTKLQSHSPSRNRRGANRTDWLTRQPAIIVTMGR